MVFPASSLLNLKSLSISQIQNIFLMAKKIKDESLPVLDSGKTIALLFFEPSTRTRMSFETAAYRVGLRPILLEGVTGTSLEKGETVKDTILNVAAMAPRFLVIRCNDETDLEQISKQVDFPILNAGWGKIGHPTQALLDAFTMLENFDGNLKGKRLLIVGDSRHSRVVASHLELLPQLGVEVEFAGPEEYLPIGRKSRIQSLDTDLADFDAVMCLRFQFERHKNTEIFSKENYRETWGLNLSRALKMKPSALIMHPGPINQGIELEPEVLNDKRCVVLEQVRNGVCIRESLLRLMLGEAL